jgi:hypothetical protein
MKMFWRFIVPSLCVLVLFFTYFKRKYDFERNSDYSQFKFKIFGGKLNKSVSMNVSTKSESGKDKSINTDLVQDGIFWSDFAESLVPKGKIAFFLVLSTETNDERNFMY